MICLLSVLVGASDAFTGNEPTQSTGGSDTSTSSDAPSSGAPPSATAHSAAADPAVLAIAEFTIVALVFVGALLLVGGVVVALADLRVVKPVGNQGPGARLQVRGLVAGGSAGVGVAIGEVAKALASALKDLKARVPWYSVACS